MIPGAAQFVQEQAQQATDQRLRRAAEFMRMRCPAILFRCTWRPPGGAKLVLQIEWPGVLKVFDHKTGEPLGESLPGCPGVAAPVASKLASDS